MSEFARDLIDSWNDAVVRSPATVGDVLKGSEPRYVRHESILVKPGLLATVDFGAALDPTTKLVSLRLLFHANNYPPEMRAPAQAWEGVQCCWRGIQLLTNAERVRSELRRSKIKSSLSSEYAEKSGSSWIIYSGSLEFEFRPLTPGGDDPSKSMLSSVAHYFDMAGLPGSPVLTFGD